QRFWIHNGEGLAQQEPQAAVTAAKRAGRNVGTDIGGIGFHAEQTFVLSVTDGTHRDGASVHRGFQVVAPDFENAAFAAEPEPTFAVGNDLRNIIVKQTLVASNLGKMSVLEPAQTGAFITDPQG